jgi:predicted enzyme related to lactoylglutathione lyase
MGPAEGVVFPYQGDGVGGAVMVGPTAPALGAGGTLVYLDASPSLDAALSMVGAAGGAIALP